MPAAESVQYQKIRHPHEPLPGRMKAAVYAGNGRVCVENVDVPAIGPGEILVRVEACGICHTDLKKIEHDLLPPPRIYGHETAGIVAAVAGDVTNYAPGDRVVLFHHIPCGHCFYCDRRLYAQCPVYKKVGITAGYEPAGGGFAQYVRVMDWIVRRGIEKIPEGISFDQACWVEPVNTCLKAVEMLALSPDDAVAVLGQGPIGLVFTMLLHRISSRIFATDGIAFRRNLSARFGARAFDPRASDFEKSIREVTEGRGADAVVVAVSAPGIVEQAVRISRPGAKILLFAQTSAAEQIEVSGAAICAGERMLLGSYSADIGLQAESARLVFSELPVSELISDRLPLDEIERGIAIATHPSERSLKVVIHPQPNRNPDRQGGASSSERQA